MKHSIGVMQGRLSPPVAGRIQAFPARTWKREFELAAQLGLRSIEWIVESPLASNPLMSSQGVHEIEKISNSTGVRVEFVCADYFMESPLVRMNSKAREHNSAILAQILNQAASLGCQGVEIPCVDASEIGMPAEEVELVEMLEPALEVARKVNIQIGLETSLAPQRFRKLFEKVNHPQLRANYDTGNSASLGYDCGEELEAYGAWVNNVHIKDRLFGGGTVPLGRGDARIDQVVKFLRKQKYKGGYILQVAREGDELSTIRRSLDQLNEWLSAIHST